MRIKYLFQTFFLFCFEFSSGQSSSGDSVALNHNYKWHYGIYFMPTISYNIGKKVYPHSPIQDPGIQAFYDNLKERNGTGFNVGFEVESKRMLKIISLSLGGSLEAFSYTGNGEMTVYDNYYFPSHISGPFQINYSYKDIFLNLPMMCNFMLFAKNKHRLNVLLGGSVSYFKSEINSDNWGNEYENLASKKDRFTSFGIAGLDYFYGKKILLNIGLRSSAQIITTPSGRRLASIGIKTGIFF